MQLPITIQATVTSGKGRGKDMGIPTINFQIPASVDIAYGVYAGWLHAKESKYPIAIHFGPRPQFDETDPSLEAYVLSGIVTNTQLHYGIEFVGFIRGEKTFKFSSVEAMLRRIDQDIQEIKLLLQV